MGRLALLLVRVLWSLRGKALRAAWRRQQRKWAGESIRWDYTPHEAWDLIKLKDEPGWVLLHDQQMRLVSDSIEYMGGAVDPKDLIYKRGFKDGIVKTVTLLDKMIGVGTDDEELVKRAQKELRESA